VVLITTGVQTSRHRTSRHVKNISAVICTTRKSQDCMALQRVVQVSGMRIGRNWLLKHRDEPCVRVNLFENDIPNVFLPQLANIRVIWNVRAEHAVFSRDNCSPHLAAIVLEVVSAARVSFLTFPPRTAQSF
jgi:hypothetical protein